MRNQTATWRMKIDILAWSRPASITPPPLPLVSHLSLSRNCHSNCRGSQNSTSSAPQISSLTNLSCRRGLLCTSLLETRQPQGRRKLTSTLGPGQQASLHRHCCKCLTCQVAAIVLGLRTPRVVPRNVVPYKSFLPAGGALY